MPRALIIDDDELFRNMVSTLFERLDFVVDEAEDGVEGIQCLKKTKYDVVTLDINMPKLDGEQVMAILHKRNEEIPPVIVISGFLSKEKIVNLASLGAKGFLRKPFKMKSFFIEVNKVCPIKSSSQSA
ncbi:MAG: response regulator [bacterium]|nr:response regulator [bacterium]